MKIKQRLKFIELFYITTASILTWEAVTYMGLTISATYLLQMTEILAMKILLILR